MNSNNWLSFPLSPTHSSLPPHHFSLGLVNENIDNPYQNQEWNLIGNQGSNEVKVADFLGVGNSDHHQSQPEMVSYGHEIQTGDSDYLFQSNLAQVQDPLAVVPAVSQNHYSEIQESGSIQSLTLSMGSGKGSSNGEPSASVDTSSTSIVEAVPRRALDTFGQRTSIYRGVTRHRWTGRYEAHLWDNSCRREGQSRKGRQVYLGGYDKEDKAARAYDLAALKYWGTSTTTNFAISTYEKEIEEMKHMTRQEFVASIRRKSSGFSRGASQYRGVTRHHQHGRWQARIGRVAGNKDLYLGTFTTEEEAAEAYDIAAIKFRGLNAVTNFDMSRYDVKSILESNTLPIGGGAAKRLKEAQALESSRKREEMLALSSTFQYGATAAHGGAVMPLQAYPLMQQPYDISPPLLTLQNHHDLSLAQYNSQESQYQSYMQTQLQLHQHAAVSGGGNGGAGYNYNNFMQNNPALMHGLMNLGSENNGSSSGSYNGGGYLGMAANSGSGGGGAAEDLALVKVDYDVPSGGYAGWSGESVQGGSNPGQVFSMWNE